MSHGYLGGWERIPRIEAMLSSGAGKVESESDSYAQLHCKRY